MAVDDAGTLWFESGERGKGLVTKVSTNASIVVDRIGPIERSERGTPFWLAPDRRGGLLVATPTAVLALVEGGLSTVAGTRQADADDTGDRGDGGPLSGARFRRIVAISTDDSGNAYVAEEVDSSTARIAIRFLNRGEQPVTIYPGTPHQLEVAPGTVETIVGASGRGGASGGAPLIAHGATLAVSAERLYLASTEAGPPHTGTVRMLNLGGAPLAAHGTEVEPTALEPVATVAGGPSAGGGPVSGGVLSGIAVDDQANVFLVDRSNHRVHRLDGAGTVTRFAGTGRAGYNGNDRAATQASLDEPSDVEVGPGGRVYISDAGNGQMRFVDQAGIIRAALGNGAADQWDCSPTSGDATARTGTPVSVDADAAGNVYLASERLRMVHRLSPSGTVQPVTGRLQESLCGERRACPEREGERVAMAQLSGIAAVAGHPAGGLYVQERDRVRFMNLTRDTMRVHGSEVDPGTVRTVVGAADTATSPDGHSAVDGGGERARSASVNSSVRRGSARGGELVADQRGNLMILDGGPEGPGRVRQVDAGGTITELFRGRGSDQASGATEVDRCCTFPQGLALDDLGNLYVSDGAPGRVWFLNRGATTVEVHGVSVAPGAAEAVAGSPRRTPGIPDDGIPALEAELARPGSMALDGVGNLYVADEAQHSVRRVDRQGIITTVVGSGEPGFNGDHLKGPLTALDRPTDLTIDRCGNLIIADAGNDRVRRLTLVTACAEQGSPPRPAPSRRAMVIAVALILGTIAAVGVRLSQARRNRDDPRGGLGVPGVGGEPAGS